MPTTFVLRHDGDRVGFTYGDPYECVYGGPEVEAVAEAVALLRDLPTTGGAPDGDGGYSGSMQTPATGASKAVELAVRLADRVVDGLSIEQLEGETATAARESLREEHPTVFRDRGDRPLGVYYLDAKVQELARDLGEDPDAVEAELRERRAEESSTRAAVHTMRADRNALLGGGVRSDVLIKE